jgi:hypothetical protein
VQRKIQKHKKRKKKSKTSESDPAILANRLKAFSIRAAQRDTKSDSRFFAWIRG